MKQESQFTLAISKVNESLFTGLAHSVTVPGSEGELTVLAHHEPIISKLKSGTITVRGGDTVQQFVVKSGILEVSNNQVTILV